MRVKCVGRLVVSAMTHTPASGRVRFSTVPPMLDPSTSTTAAGPDPAQPHVQPTASTVNAAASRPIFKSDTFIAPPQTIRGASPPRTPLAFARGAPTPRSAPAGAPVARLVRLSPLTQHGAA